MVSIIIPVYNSEKSIRRTIESVLNQSCKEFELILIDDGSTDSSYAICNGIAKENCNIIVISQVNSGAAEARNRGIEVAGGDYIAFVDADDTVDENWLSLLNDIIIEYKPDLVINGYKLMFSRNEEYKVRNIIAPAREFVNDKELVIHMTEKLINESVFNHVWNKLYRTEVIKKNSLQLNREFFLGEDFSFNLHYVQVAESVYITSASPYNYTVNSDGITHRFTKEKFVALKKVTREFHDFLIKNNLSLDGYYHRLIRNCFSSFMELFHKDCSFSFEEKKNEVKKIIHDPDVKKMLKDYNAHSLKQRILLSLLKFDKEYFILLLSKLFYFKKFKYNQKWLSQYKEDN